MTIASGRPKEDTAVAYNVLLVDDHKIMRDGIRTILERIPDFHIVGEARMARTP